MRKTVRAWPPVHEESDLHQACADNDHDKAMEIINLKMSGDMGAFLDLRRLLLRPNDNKQAWTRHSPHYRQTSNPNPNPNPNPHPDLQP